jgi:hypothetical protein
MAANGISTLPTKELRQKAKLNLATVNRFDVGNPRSTYDITLLPTQYVGDIPIPNPHPLGLILGRPWIETVSTFTVYEAFGTTSALQTTQYVLGNKIYAYSSSTAVPGYQNARVVVNDIELLNTGPESPRYTPFVANNTAQAAGDVISLANTLAALPSVAHGLLLGNGEVLTPGVYQINGAASIGGVLTLDAQGDPDAIFVIKSNGALNSGATSQVALANGADPANIFWLAAGAVALGASTTFYGTAVAVAGAASIGANSTMIGRLLSTAGEVSINTTQLSVPYNIGPLSIPMGVLKSFAMFSADGAVANTATSTIVGDIGTNAGVIAGFVTPTVLDGYIYPVGSATVGNGVRGHSMVVLDTFGDVISTFIYDTYGVPDALTVLAEDLANVVTGNIVVLVVYDSSALNADVRAALIANYNAVEPNTWLPGTVDHIFIGVKA